MSLYGALTAPEFLVEYPKPPRAFMAKPSSSASLHACKVPSHIALYASKTLLAIISSGTYFDMISPVICSTNS